MTIENILKEMEKDYWFSYHNKYGVDTLSSIFYSYQYCLNQYHVLDRPIPENDYERVRNHFYKEVLKDEKTKRR